MVRSILLRGYDQECAEMIGAYMSRRGTKFIRQAVPKEAIKNNDNGKIRITYIEPNTKEEIFDE